MDVGTRGKLVVFVQFLDEITGGVLLTFDGDEDADTLFKMYSSSIHVLSMPQPWSSINMIYFGPTLDMPVLVGHVDEVQWTDADGQGHSDSTDQALGYHYSFHKAFILGLHSFCPIFTFEWLQF